MSVPELSLQGTLMLARHAAALRAQATSPVLASTPDLPRRSTPESSAFRHVTMADAPGGGAVLVVAQWVEQGMEHTWHLTVPNNDATPEFLWSLERMARRRAGTLLTLLK